MFTEAQILQALDSLEEIEPGPAPVPAPRLHCGTCYRSDEGPELPIGWSRSWRAAGVVFCDSCRAFVASERAAERDGGEW